MGRAIPSFRLALAMEEIEWKKSFRNALSESDRKKIEKTAEKDKEVKPKHCYGITG